MGVTVVWDNEERSTLHYQFEGIWMWDQYLAALWQGRAMMKQVEHPVCIINNMLNTSQVPTSSLSSAKKVIQNRPANTGLAVFVINNKFLMAIYKVFSQMNPNLRNTYIAVHSMDEARSKIAEWQKKHQFVST